MTALAPDRPAGHDLRLLPVAAAAWAVAAVTLSVPASAPALLAACLLVALAGAVVARARPRGSSRGHLARGHGLARRPGLAAGLATAAVAAALAGATACAVSAVRLRAVHGGPLLAAALAHSQVALDVVVTGDPHRGESAGVAGAVHSFLVVQASARRLDDGGRRWRMSSPVLLITADTPAWATVLPSQRVHLTGRAAPPRGRDLLAAVVTVRGPPLRSGRPSLVQRVAGHVRRSLAEAATAAGQPVAGLLPGLVDGDTSALDPRLAADFRVAGMTHLVAVSGANTAIAFGAVLALVRRSFGSVRASAVVAALALLGFVVVARPSPSVLRAGGMAALTLAAIAAGRPASAVPALLGTVLVLVLVDPGLALQPGLALSVLATAGLLLGAPPLAARLRRRLPGWLADVVAMAVAAQLACAPLIVALWGQLSVVAVAANMLAEPVVPLTTVLGGLTALVAPLSMPVARALARLAGVPANWLVWVSHHAAAMPMASLALPTGPVPAALVAVALAALTAALLHRRTSPYVVSAAVGSLVAGCVVATAAPGWPPPGWVLTACDVGQGDALAVRVGPRQALLVDAGPLPAAVDRCLHGLRVASVPLVVLSHLHADHVEGLPGVLDGRAVGAVATGPLAEPAAEERRVRSWAAGARVPVRPLPVGARFVVGAATVQVIGPARVLHGTDSDPNNDSLVLRVSDAGVTLLLTGDVEAPAQQALLASGADLRADVLKVPHHGSADQDPGLVAAVHPRLAVVSVGLHNTYGHPAPATLARLAAAGVPTYRTDRDGDVAVVARGAGRIEVVRRGAGRSGARALPGSLGGAAVPSQVRALTASRWSAPLMPVVRDDDPPPPAVRPGSAPTARAPPGAQLVESDCG
ncbi:MAG: ComEC/Rec2 family competence protein [Frankiaceae bacterium]